MCGEGQVEGAVVGVVVFAGVEVRFGWGRCRWVFDEHFWLVFGCVLRERRERWREVEEDRRGLLSVPFKGCQVLMVVE